MRDRPRRTPSYSHHGLLAEHGSFGVPVGGALEGVAGAQHQRLVEMPADEAMTEVEDLMGLLRRYLQSEIAEFHKNGIRLRVIGDRARLPRDIVRLIDDAEKRTADNQALDLVIAISYGGRQEIIDALAGQAYRQDNR